jgi:hypothetical protein
MPYILDSPVPSRLAKTWPPMIPPPCIDDSTKIQMLIAKQQFSSPVGILNQLAQMLHLPMPEYTFFNLHNEFCICDVQLGNQAFVSIKPRMSTRQAKEDAAIFALKVISNDPSIITAGEPTDTNQASITSYTSALVELCQHKGWETPKFTFDSHPLVGGWRCNIVVRMKNGGYHIEREEVFNKKHEAKEHVAKAMYEQLIAISDI